MKVTAFFAGIVVAATAASHAALAVSPESRPLGTDLITETVIEDIREWLMVPLVDTAVSAQNTRYGALGQAKIDDLDKDWRAQREVNDQPLIAATLGNPLSTYLTQIQAKSLGLFTEIFVMDRNGLNVGQSSVTSDFWQGDEAKYQKTFPVAPGHVFVDEPEYDESRGIWRAQVNMALIGREAAGNVGVATIEINLTELARRRALGL